MSSEAKLVSCVVIAITLSSTGLVIWSSRGDAEAKRLAAEAEVDKKIRAGGEFYKPLDLVLNYPGIEQPPLLEANAVDIPSSTQIIGIKVGERFCAFVVDSMLLAKHHIVNLVFNEKPLSVTYCNISDCVRVLTNDDMQPIPLRVGGLDKDGRMVFLLNEKRCGQGSKHLPLNDHDFVRMTFGEWKSLHPETQVYFRPKSTAGKPGSERGGG